VRWGAVTATPTSFLSDKKNSRASAYVIRSLPADLGLAEPWPRYRSAGFCFICIRRLNLTNEEKNYSPIPDVWYAPLGVQTGVGLKLRPFF